MNFFSIATDDNSDSESEIEERGRGRDVTFLTSTVWISLTVYVDI